MELNAFSEFGVVIGLAAMLGIIATKLKQPPILGYILTGLILGPLTPYFNPESTSTNLLASIGVTFLLFTLGLELKLSELKKLGKVSFATGLGQIIFTSIIGFIIAQFLGFSSVESFYIAIGLTFSSTIIIIKLLSHKNKLDTLYGKISVGFLLVQDFVAILILIWISTMGKIGGASIESVSVNMLMAILKGIVAIAIIYVFVRFILNPVLNSLRMEKEVMFITVLAWALLLAAVFSSEQIGFTKEFGGLIAGIALANRFEHLQLESWTRPLRDFFLALFFVLLGSNIQVESLGQAFWPAIIFSVFVLIGNPIIVMIILGVMGYRKKTSFLTSLAVAQISEFSLILIGYAYTELNAVDNLTLTIMALVGGITMTISSYMIYYNEELYESLSKYLGIFEIKKNNKSEEDIAESNYSDKKIILFGCHRMGRNLLRQMPDEKDNILIIDLDPKNVRDLRDLGYDVLYADMSDDMMFDFFHLAEAEVVISTVPSLKENHKLLQYISEMKYKPVTLMTATEGESAKKLYEYGADFVIYPHLVSSEILTEIIKKRSLSKKFIKSRSRHMEGLSALI